MCCVWERKGVGANTSKWVAGLGIAAACNTLCAGTAWVPGSTVDEGVIDCGPWMIDWMSDCRDGQVCQGQQYTCDCMLQ